MNGRQHAPHDSSFITPHSSFAFILSILSIPVNYSLSTHDSAGRDPLARVFLHLFEEQVLAPFGARLGVVAEEHALQADAQRLLSREQGHARLFGRAVALARVAGDAGRGEVFRRGVAAARARRDVVERQLVRGLPRAAVLAAESVAHEDAEAAHACALASASD